MTFNTQAKRHYLECHLIEVSQLRPLLSIIMLRVVLLNVVMLNAMAS
jgi:hypothetical protein